MRGFTLLSAACVLAFAAAAPVPAAPIDADTLSNAPYIDEAEKRDVEETLSNGVYVVTEKRAEEEKRDVDEILQIELYQDATEKRADEETLSNGVYVVTEKRAEVNGYDPQSEPYIVSP